jgi:hypothetical protein
LFIIFVPFLFVIVLSVPLFVIVLSVPLFVIVNLAVPDQIGAPVVLSL